MSNNSLRIKYLTYKKKIYNCTDLLLFDKDFDMSNYTLIMDSYRNTHIHIIGKKFKKVIIDHKNFTIDSYAKDVNDIFTDIILGNFTSDSFDIILNTTIDNTYNCDTNTKLMTILKNHNVTKFYDDNLLLEKNDVLKNSRLHVRLKNYDSVHLEKNITDIDILNLTAYENVNIYAKMTSLTRVFIQTIYYGAKIYSVKPLDFSVYEQLFANNKITDVAIDIGMVHSYPNIMNLFCNIKVFRLYGTGLYDANLLTRIFDHLSNLTLDKFVMRGISGADIVSIYLNRLATINVRKIKIYNVSTYVDINQFYHMISNPNVKNVYFGGCFGTPSGHYTIESMNHYNLDHLKELHINIASKRDYIYYRYIENYLEQTLTSNSEIVRIDFVNDSVSSPHILNLIDKNLDYNLNRLYRITKAIDQTLHI